MTAVLGEGEHHTFMLHALIPQLREVYAQATPEFLTLASTQYTARDGIFYKDIQGMLRRVVPTPELQSHVLRTLHRESHHNSAKSLKQEIRSFALWWPGLEESVRKFVLACPQCQVYRRKSRTQDKVAHHRDRIFTPGSCYAWYVDVMQINPPCANTGFTHVLIFVEESMKYTILRCFKGVPNTDDIKLCVRDRVIHQNFGVPRHFRSDG